MATAWLDAQWPVPANVRAFTTLRHGLGVSQPPFDDFNLGSRSGDEADAVQRNRALLVEHAHLPSAPRWLRQVHGVEVCRFDGSHPSFDGPHPNPSPAGGRGAESGVAGRIAGGAAPEPFGRGQDEGSEEPEADASVTSTPGTVLAILTADCMPVLFCADDGSEVAAAHAGWRGLAAGVLENTMGAMRTAPKRLHVWLGPAAGPQAYEIGEEVYDAFVSKDWAAGSAFVSTRPHHWRVDLYALARRRLHTAGIDPAHIHGGDRCTISEPRHFFSHRRDQRTGRMVSLIWIEPDR